MRNFSETLQIAKGVAVTPGSPLVLETGFPMGGLLDRLDFHLHIALTQTTASNATTEGLLLFCKNFVFRGGNDHFVKNVCGRALYYNGLLVNGTPPGTDTWATTTATTYDLHIPIPFGDNRMDWPSDTRIDTRRYSSTGFHFEFLPGTLTDLFGTVGDAAITVTADLSGVYENGFLNPVGGPGMPKGYREYSQPAPQNPAIITSIDIERNKKYFLRRLLVQAANSATSGAAFSGTPANTTLSDLSFETNIRTHFSPRPEQNIRWENKLEYGLETALTGYYMLDFLMGKSNLEMLPTDPENLSQLVLKWTLATASTSQVSTMIDGFRLY